jgi:hypothetical protein
VAVPVLLSSPGAVQESEILLVAVFETDKLDTAAGAVMSNVEVETTFDKAEMFGTSSEVFIAK